MKMLKLVLIGFVFLFVFSSCKDGRLKKLVTSGEAQVWTTVFSKQCAGGSVHIKAETVSEGGVGLDVDNLKPGDKVQISGTVANNICQGSGSISFSCEGAVRIDTNRAFSCNAGSLGLAGSVSSTSHSLFQNPFTPSSPGISAPATAFKVIGVQVHIYQNGTQVFTKVDLSRPPHQLFCPVSFVCD